MKNSLGNYIIYNIYFLHKFTFKKHIKKVSIAGFELLTDVFKMKIIILCSSFQLILNAKNCSEASEDLYIEDYLQLK
jgi:hypothetical protein